MTVALLAPVPSVHLASALEHGMTTIALGTRAWETLTEFTRVAGRGAPVVIYASHDEGGQQPATTWTGTFGQYRDAEHNGLVPRALKPYRPPSMAQEDREARHWFGYFTIDGLDRLDEPKMLTDLRQWSGEAPLSPAFVPHGPLIVVM
jgi:hypothetical protein